MVVRDACKGLEDTVALFKREKRSIFTPPPEPAYMKEKVFNKKADRVQFVDSAAHSGQDDLLQISCLMKTRTDRIEKCSWTKCLVLISKRRMTTMR